MADIIIESIFNKDIFTWNNSNMVKPDKIRKNYIVAIKEADNGNINSLIEFARNKKRIKKRKMNFYKK